MHEQPVPYRALLHLLPLHTLGSLFVVESHDHDAEVIRRVAGEGVLEEAFGSFLRVLAAPDEVDRRLVVANVPELTISLYHRCRDRRTYTITGNNQEFVILIHDSLGGIRRADHKLLHRRIAQRAGNSQHA